MCEAEYIISCSGTKEAIWLKNILSTLLGAESPTLTSILIGSQGSISSDENISINARNKDTDTRHHFVRDAVARKDAILMYCPTKEQMANILTKPLLRILFEKLCEAIGISDSVKPFK